MLVAIIIIAVIAVVAVKTLNNSSQNNKINTLMESANQGDSYSQYELGHYYFFTAHDIDNAVYWLVLSEANGNPQATALIQQMINAGAPRIHERIENAKANIYANQ